MRIFRLDKKQHCIHHNILNKKERCNNLERRFEYLPGTRKQNESPLNSLLLYQK